MKRIIAMVVLIATVSSGCIPEGQTEPRVFVANESGVVSVGYNSCRYPAEIRSAELTDETGAKEDILWKVALEDGPPVGRVSLGVTPPGYRTVVAFKKVATQNAEHLGVGITGVDGYVGGIAADDFLTLSEGTLRWSLGIRRGNDISDIKKSTFGC